MTDHEITFKKLEEIRDGLLISINISNLEITFFIIQRYEANRLISAIHFPSEF